ncbi:MAG: LemA family protein [Chitinophagales bacterium]|nr:LemA family protein [Chitinophagales bacterium]
MGFIVLLAIIALPILFVVFIYNNLIGKKNKVEYAFSSIDVMLKKRRDLIPNLIDTVKEYMVHERELLTEITQLRSQAMSGGISDEEMFHVEKKLSGRMGQFKIAVENYPDLKANQNFLNLQASLNDVEEQISASRRAYNAAVMEYNNAIEMFPSNILANKMGYLRRPSFEIPEVERQNVDVKALFNRE